ncbi:nuclear transport factor 2 family protein [uncultured Roseobacter sp.]|uniref:nuclear transport factor 2 family protein n=1 Tax=uncultured Roseobacter sp. TaxID=114847 RepID=UPI002629B040|nr:nuclear transport factor 2 family protein [uncultured Roseobacter sp.]
MKALLAALAALTLMNGMAMAQTLTPEQTADRAAIIATIDAVGFHADQRAWDRVAEQFSSDGVVLDYRSYAAASAGTDGEPAPQPREDIIAAWRTVLPGYDMTQHVTSNHQVALNDDSAIVQSTIHATHILDGEQWIFLGDYEHALERTDDGWKITRMTANMRGDLGNNDLPRLATERVAAANGNID